MRKIFSIVILAVFTVSAIGQKLDMSQLKGWEPRSIGPAGMSGRVTCIDVELQNTNHMVIGTASGGVWESFNEGISWHPIFDDAPVQSIGAIVINQNNPAEIYVGTGEGNPRNSHNSGIGMFKTINGGKDWKAIGLENSRNIHRLIIDPQNSNIIYAGVLGSAWGESEDRGVFKSIDAGKTWKKILYNNPTTGCADLIMDSKNPNKLYAAMWQFGRKPWFFESGGEGSGLYISFDGGDTWEKRTENEGLPKGNLGRIGLAQPASKPNIIYALVEAEKTGLYKSVDGGFKWNLVSTKNIGNRPFYYADIYADPLNENRLYNLYSVVTKSDDGGKSFYEIASYSKVHPDHHAFWIHPTQPDFVIDGNDGGLNISKDGGMSWRYVTNLPLGQFYHINVDNDMPYNVYGGLQDNGSWVGPAYVYEGQGIRNYHWQEVVFGDGFDVVPQRDNNRYGFAMYQGGNLKHYDIQTGATSHIQPVHPNKDSTLRFNWNAAIAQDPFLDSGIYFGSQYVHYSANCGKSWKIISSDLTTNDTAKQKQALSGGLTIDATKAENFTTIVCIAPSSIDSLVIWASTDDGNLQITKNGGKSWQNVSSKVPGAPKGAWIPQVVASTHIAGEAYVVVNDYRRNNWDPFLFKTMDYGQSWTRIATPDKIKGHIWSVVQDPVERNLLFAGSEHGLWVSIDGGSNWTQWTEGMPAVPVSDLKIQSREHDLVIGTFGRAIYILDDIRPLRELVKNADLSNKKLVAFDPPTAYRHPWRTPKGVRFAADADFRGDNKWGGAVFTLWIHPELISEKPEPKGDKKVKKEDSDQKKNSKKGSKDEKVKVVVYRANGDSIRQFSFKADSMIVRSSWNMTENGVWGPRRDELNDKQKENVPSGVSVLPGKYKLVFEFKGERDSIEITIDQHPKYTLSQQELSSRYDLAKSLEGEIASITKTVDRLREMKTLVNNINGQSKYLPDSIADTIKAKGKIVLDSVNTLMDLFFLKEGFEGYDHVSENIGTRIGRVRSYLYSENATSNETLQIAWRQLAEEMIPIMERTNKLVENEWNAYTNLVNLQSFEFFKPLDPLNYGR